MLEGKGILQYSSWMVLDPFIVLIVEWSSHIQHSFTHVGMTFDFPKLYMWMQHKIMVFSVFCKEGYAMQCTLFEMMVEE